MACRGKELGKACGSRAPWVRNMLGDERVTEAVLDFLLDTKVGFMVPIAPLEEEGEGEAVEGEIKCILLLFLHIFPLSFLCSFLCPNFSGGSGRKEQGSPTMTRGVEGECRLGLPWQLAVCSRINIKDNTLDRRSQYINQFTASR